MSINIQIINTAIVSFQGWIDRDNQVIAAMANGVLTANTDANGSFTYGNCFLEGIFAANTIHANVISGGNVQINTGFLSIFCNSIFLGNSVTNAYANSTTLYVPNGQFVHITGNSEVLLSSLAVGIGVTNSFVNTSYGRFSTLQFTAANGATANLATSLTIGGATNTFINATAAAFGGNVSANLYTGNTATLLLTVSIGSGGTNVTINTTSVNASLGLFGTVNGGIATFATSLTIGDNTTNTFIVPTIATFAGNVAANIMVAAARVSVGTGATNTTVNTTTVTTNTIITGTPAVLGFKANTTAIQLNSKTYTNLDPYVMVANNGTLIGTRPKINFISSASAVAALVDNVAQDRVDITLTAVATIGGSTTHVQFNDSGVFGGNAGFTYTKSTNTVAVANTLIAANLVTTAFKANATHLSLNSKNYSNLDPYVIVANGGVTVGTRPKINFIPGTSTTIDVTDSNPNDRVDVQIGINAVSLSAGVIGGGTTQVQFNDAGAFNGHAGLIFIKTTSNLTVGNTMIAATANVTTVLLPSSKMDNVTNTYASAAAAVFDSFFLSEHRGAEYIITVKDNTANAYQISKVLLLQDGGGATLTEYATIISNTVVGTFTASANATHAILTFTSAASINTTLKASRNIIVV